MIHFHDDPTLAELLSDPITQAVMTADRVDPRELKPMLASIARAIGRRQGAWVSREAASGCVSDSCIRSR